MMRPRVDADTADFCYVRLHGPTKLYSSLYTHEQLQTYADLIKRKLDAGKNVFVYFNNTQYGMAIENARILQHLVTASGIPTV